MYTDDIAKFVSGYHQAVYYGTGCDAEAARALTQQYQAWILESVPWHLSLGNHLKDLCRAALHIAEDGDMRTEDDGSRSAVTGREITNHEGVRMGRVECVVSVCEGFTPKDVLAQVEKDKE